ncbi:unnamed protein product [Peniophora sp. CBMAI 1063]|nr:unnamed protein product [Peniophora sp. CBMAI 1063]
MVNQVKDDAANALELATDDAEHMCVNTSPGGGTFLGVDRGSHATGRAYARASHGREEIIWKTPSARRSIFSIARCPSLRVASSSEKIMA